MGALGFANAVKPGGKWDYKNADSQKGTIFESVAKFQENTDKRTEFNFQSYKFSEDGADLGNFNYGYTGRNVGGDGYSPMTLWMAAGVLQTGKDLLQRNWSKALGKLNTMHPILRLPYGDEMDDFFTQHQE